MLFIFNHCIQTISAKGDFILTSFVKKNMAEGVVCIVIERLTKLVLNEGNLLFRVSDEVEEPNLSYNGYVVS